MSSSIFSPNTIRSRVQIESPSISQVLPQAKSRSDIKGRHQSPRALWLLLSVPAFLIAFYAINFLFDWVHLGDPDIITRVRASIWSWIHIGGGIAGIGLGPFQFLESLRRREPWVHRWIGRIYTTGVVIGGASAFHVSFNSLCRPAGKLAFAFLGFIWLVTGIIGTVKIWDGQVIEHRKWMMRNFSLTYAAVMLRWQLPLFITLGLEVEPALSLTGVTSWLPNLLFAEWWIRNRV